MAATTAAVSEALAAARDAFAAAGVPDPRSDAELLLASALGIDRAALAAEPERPIDSPSARRYADWVRRRLAREPVAYILGRAHFRRLGLGVDPRVLIPRPETEHLVEVALELLASRPGGTARVCEVGTGSGAVALALVDESREPLELVATDVSADALELARANADRLGRGSELEFRHCDLLPAGRFDLVVSNPPYVAEPDWDGLAPEITRHEPPEALLAGPDGLALLRRLCRQAPESVAAGGHLCVEVGQGQAAAVAALMEEAGLVDPERRRDLAGIERVVWARRP